MLSVPVLRSAVPGLKGTLDLFALVPADAPPLGEPLEDTARRAAATLQISLDEAIELRTPRPRPTRKTNNGHFAASPKAKRAHANR